MRSRNIITSSVSLDVPYSGGTTEFAVTHGLVNEQGLAMTPRGWFITRRFTNAVLSETATAWTTTTAYLKGSAAGARFTVMFFG